MRMAPPLLKGLRAWFVLQKQKTNKERKTNKGTNKGTKIKQKQLEMAHSKNGKKEKKRNAKIKM